MQECWPPFSCSPSSTFSFLTSNYKPNRKERKKKISGKLIMKRKTVADISHRVHQELEVVYSLLILRKEGTGPTDKLWLLQLVTAVGLAVWHLGGKVALFACRMCFTVCLTTNRTTRNPQATINWVPLSKGKNVSDLPVLGPVYFSLKSLKWWPPPRRRPFPCTTIC